MNRESQRLPTSLISEGLKNSANFFCKYSLLNTTPNLICLRFKISDLFSITPFSFTEFKGQNLDKKISSLLLTEGNEINCVNHEPSNKIFDCCTIDFQTFNRKVSNELIKSPLNKDLGIVDIDSEDQSHGHSVIPNPSKEQHSSKFTESKKFETKAISQIYKPLFQVKKAQSREKKKRFGRKQDKELFDQLKKCCNVFEKEMSDFWNYPYPLPKDLRCILKTVFKTSKWRGSLKELYNRIGKLGNSQFSVREVKLLKKLSKEQLKNKKIDYDTLSYHLPGKSIQAIKRKLIEGNEAKYSWID